MKKGIYQHKVYSGTYVSALANGSSNVQTIAIAGNKDFRLSHIEIFCDNKALNSQISFQDTTTNENWQNTPCQIDALSPNSKGPIPFVRYLKRNTEVTVTIANNSGGARNYQVSLIGTERRNVMAEKPGD